MLAKRLPTILPPLSSQESLETTRVYLAAGKVPADTRLIGARLVRLPHHSISIPALVGVGTIPTAGEVSLAHHGVLFLDEFSEFSRSVLESLRQVIPEDAIVLTRGQRGPTRGGRPRSPGIC